MRKLKNAELGRISAEDYKEASKIPLAVVLDNVRSANNVGSVFRTSDAFLVQKVFLCGITACPPNKDIHKTALGATDSVAWEHFQSTQEAVKALKEDGFTIYAVEQVEKSHKLGKFIPSEGEKIALVFGNEVKGVDQKVVDECDGAIEIPQFGTKHSLNISVSAGVVIWDIFNKMHNLA